MTESESGPPLDARAAGRATPAQGLPERLAELQGERLYRAIGLIFLLALVFRYLDAISMVVLVAFVGAILGIAFNAVVARLPLPRGIATIAVALLVLFTIGLGLYFLMTVLVAQIRALVEDLPAILATLEEWQERLQQETGIEIELMGPRVQELITGFVGDGTAILTGAFGLLELLALTLLVLVGAFFVVAKPNKQLLDPLMRAVPHHRRDPFRRMFHRIGERLSAWLFGTLIAMVAVGILAIAAFYLLDAPYPFLLGSLVGLTNVVPLVGPWIGGLLAVIVTLFHAPMTAVWVAVAVLVIQEVESNAVRPLVMSQAAEVHPFVTLLALLLFAAMFGLLGAILALPLLLAIGTAVEVLWVEEALDAQDDEIEPVVRT